MERVPALSGEQLALLADYFGKQAHVAAAFLFGSRGRGTARPDSDVDIAVLMEHDAPDDVMRPVTFTNELMRLLGREDIDVVVLNSASPLLKHRVIRDGYVLFRTSNTVLAEFGIRVMAEYEDTRPLRELQRRQTEALWSRIGAGQQ